MIRLVSWNVEGRALWDDVEALDVDVALLQEAPAPPDAVAPHMVPEPSDGWATTGWLPGRWSRRTGILRTSDRVALTPHGAGIVGDRDSAGIPASRPGTITVADVAVEGETFTVAAVYGGWERPPGSTRPIYADAAAHRLLSDLSAILTHPTRHRLIVAGDLNILYGYGDYGNVYWGRRYATVFERAEALGLRMVGPQAPKGRQADPWPEELPADSRNVPTYHTSRQGPAGATRQLDFVFASAAIADRVEVTALNGVNEWGPSDHCRILIEVDLPVNL